MLEKYIRLKATMIENNIFENDINKMLGRGAYYIQNRMDGTTSWRLDDVYKICDILHIPYDEIHLYFPK